VTPDQAEQAVGSDTVAQVAADAGVSHEEAKNQLAEALPQLIDKSARMTSCPTWAG
jgi:uncharacterized protein YidB (DUF937 family)